eukprot:gene5335-10334_t
MLYTRGRRRVLATAAVVGGGCYYWLLSSLLYTEYGAFYVFAGKITWAADCPNLKEVGGIAFNEASNAASSVVFDKSPLLETIGRLAFRAFKGNVQLVGEFPRLSSIDEYVFYDNSASTSAVVINNAPLLETIGKYAFYGFKGNVQLVGEFPQLSYIGSSAFKVAQNPASRVEIECRSDEGFRLGGSAFTFFKGTHVGDGEQTATPTSTASSTIPAMDATTTTAAGTAIDIPTSLLLKPIKRSQGSPRLYVDGSPEDRQAVADGLNAVLSDGTKSVNSSFALIVITGLLRVDGTEEDCNAVAAGLNGVSHGTKSVKRIVCYDYDWMGRGDWALQTDEGEDVNVLNAVLNERANSELARVTLDADGWGAFGNSTATSKAGGMSAGAVVGVLFAIIAVVGVGAAAFKFRHKLVTMGRKDGGATEPGLALTMNTQHPEDSDFAPSTVGLITPQWRMCPGFVPTPGEEQNPSG